MECGDPLVDLHTVAALWRLSPTLLRRGVVDRLVAAQSFLPLGLRFVVVQGLHIASDRCCAPHDTGGAVDLGVRSTEGSDLSAEDVNRQLLRRALSTAGMVDHPPQWWHWSYGDRQWALRTGAPAARYGPIDRG